MKHLSLNFRELFVSIAKFFNEPDCQTRQVWYFTVKCNLVKISDNKNNGLARII